MRRNNFSRLRIAEFLGRHLQVVHDALRQFGTVDLKDRHIPHFGFLMHNWNELKAYGNRVCLGVLFARKSASTSVKSLWRKHLRVK